ncbi:uncharacterized protein BDR25DRAFT_354927 [Lindgomyces ingoldianus]|uniref:Uncharacterized protein n=1 Tax=Lindgomyces ingoldianus TaxID=673940 RepID=A0ACB6QVI0_9PLEO|nr:uncharacterized protein BDR25DRAFT_354927 [Lindgomyces ingoldianus]KAF2471014.1 hypothetical protein BDR25DRAFT_354927 [Lindgomyces ingoldianus]
MLAPALSALSPFRGRGDRIPHLRPLHLEVCTSVNFVLLKDGIIHWGTECRLASANYAGRLDATSMFSSFGEDKQQPSVAGNPKYGTCDSNPNSRSLHFLILVIHHHASNRTPFPNHHSYSYLSTLSLLPLSSTQLNLTSTLLTPKMTLVLHLSARHLDTGPGILATNRKETLNKPFGCNLLFHAFDNCSSLPVECSNIYYEAGMFRKWHGPSSPYPRLTFFWLSLVAPKKKILKMESTMAEKKIEEALNQPSYEFDPYNRLVKNAHMLIVVTWRGYHVSGTMTLRTAPKNPLSKMLGTNPSEIILT